MFKSLSTEQQACVHRSIMFQYVTILQRLAVAHVEHRDLHAKNLLYDWGGEGACIADADANADADAGAGDGADAGGWSRLRILLTVG